MNPLDEALLDYFSWRQMSGFADGLESYMLVTRTGVYDHSISQLLAMNKAHAEVRLDNGRLFVSAVPVSGIYRCRDDVFDKTDVIVSECYEGDLRTEILQETALQYLQSMCPSEGDRIYCRNSEASEPDMFVVYGLDEMFAELDAERVAV